MNQSAEGTLVICARQAQKLHFRPFW
jgi:hypothetical protein